MDNKVICLVRVSTFAQDLEQQKNVVLSECYKLGYDDSNIIVIEDKESAVKLSEEERNGLNKLKEYIISDSSIDCVICYELSRISRRADVLYSIRDFLVSHKVNLVVLNPYFKMLDNEGKFDANSNIFFGIFGAMSENEGMIRKVRMARGKAKSKLEGKFSGGTKMYGYDVVDKRYVLNDYESNIVLKVYRDFSTGKFSLYSLAKYYFDTGLWYGMTFKSVKNKVNNILNNIKYVGNNTYPCIVDKYLFDKVNSILEDNKKNAKLKKSYDNERNLLQGLLYDDKGKSLGCSYSNSRYISANIRVSFSVIDNIVFDYVRNLYDDVCDSKDYLKVLEREYQLLYRKLHTKNRQIDEKKGMYDVIEERFINGRLSSVKRDSMIENIDNEIKRMNDDLRLLYEEKDNIESKMKVYDKGSYIDFDNMDIIEKRKFIDRYVKKIVLSKESKFTIRCEFEFIGIEKYSNVIVIDSKNKTYKKS